MILMLIYIIIGDSGVGKSALMMRFAVSESKKRITDRSDQITGATGLNR